MRVSVVWVRLAVAITLCACGAGAAWAADTPKAAPEPTQRELTEGEKALFKKLLLHTSAEPDDGPAPLTVHFTAEKFETDDPVNPKYVWDFGDGSPKVKGPDAKHTYKKPGKYKAIIRVTDDVGAAGMDDLDINVEEPEKK